MFLVGSARQAWLAFFVEKQGIDSRKTAADETNAYLGGTRYLVRESTGNGCVARIVDVPSIIEMNNEERNVRRALVCKNQVQTVDIRQRSQPSGAQNAHDFDLRLEREVERPRQHNGKDQDGSVGDQRNEGVHDEHIIQINARTAPLPIPEC